MKHPRGEKEKKSAAGPARSSVPDAPLRHADAYRLQKTIGNQAALRLLHSGVLQAKLSVSRPDDMYEQEADRVADRVLRMAEPEHPVAASLARAARPRGVMRAGLADETDETKRKLTFDTDSTSRDLKKFFGLSGTPALAKNVTDQYSYAADSIENLADAKTKADLKQGLRLYALSLFDLMPDDKGFAHSKRLNLVHVENMDLSRWGGLNENFRFTSIGQTSAGNNITVRILIESLGLPRNYMSDDKTAPGIEKTAAKYGIRRDMNNDPLATTQSSVSDDVWNKVLRSLGRIGEWMLMRLRDITFETSPRAKGPNGEAAEYRNAMNGSTVTRKIILYSSLTSADDRQFAFIIQHEIGHALDSAPAESPRGVDPARTGHNDPRFLEAAKADGGRAASVTEYGKKDVSEFYAECFAMFISERGTLAKMRPNIYKYFTEWQWEALKDPKLNPYAPQPGQKPPVGGFGPIGPF